MAVEAIDPYRRVLVAALAERAFLAHHGSRTDTGSRPRVTIHARFQADIRTAFAQVHRSIALVMQQMRVQYPHLLAGHHALRAAVDLVVRCRPVGHRGVACPGDAQAGRHDHHQQQEDP